MFVYERLNFVLSFAQASPAGVRLYNVFLDLLYLHMFGVLDESNYEDAVKMVFGHQGGPAELRAHLPELHQADPHRRLRDVRPGPEPPTCSRTGWAARSTPSPCFSPGRAAS